MNNQNIIILAQQNWDTTIGTNPRNLAREFALHNRVLYVNMPLDVNTVLHGRKEPDVQKRIRVLFGQEEGLVQAEPNVWVYTTDVLLLSANWLASKSLFRAVNQLNARWLAHSIRKAAQAAGFDSFYLLQDGLIYPGLELKRLLQPRQFIYNLRDYVMGVPYFRRHGPWLEAALMQQADVVAANSAYLREYAQQVNPHSYDIGQGCVLTLYQAQAKYIIPADLAAVPGPVIGYTGYLTGLRLDIELLLTIARQRPQWSLVLVGPEDEAFAASPLHALPNVYFLGRKAPNELPAYLQHFDVCINPQLVNEITMGNYPLKIDEYLAMGKPTVATATRGMDMFAPHAYLAHAPADWVPLLDQALHEAGPGAAADRIAFARGHTWAASTQALYQALNQALDSTRQPAS